MSLLITPNGLSIKAPVDLSKDTHHILFEKIKVTQNGSPQSSIFKNCVIIYVSDRILIYQKRLFSKKCVQRFDISILNDKNSESIETKMDFVSASLSFSVFAHIIKIEETKFGYKYKIPLSNDNALTSGQSLTFLLNKKISFVKF